MLDDIQVVLCGVSHPGNMGSSARAMKNMGLSRLALVSPLVPPENEEALSRSSHAFDVLQNASVFSSLYDAVKESSCVLGLTARVRKETAAVPLFLSDAVQKALSLLHLGRVSFVFGSERTGLTNEQLMLCSHTVHIPTSEAYSSLNLAAAVQVVCYEIKRQLCLQQDPFPQKGGSRPATVEDITHLIEHVKRIAQKSMDAPPQNLSLRLSRLCSKANLEEHEVSLLRGLLSAVESSLKIK